MTSASQPDPGDDRDGGLPPELEKLFKDLTGGAEIPPEVQAALTLRFTKDVRENIDATLLSLLLPDDE